MICRNCNTNHPGGLADTQHVVTAIPRDGRIRVPVGETCPDEERVEAKALELDNTGSDSRF